MRDIFDSIFRLMDERFIQDSTVGVPTALAFRSSIAYKYKPTVRYSVELLRAPEGERIGNLKISFRTRSQAFMNMLGGFFSLWINTERSFNKRVAEYKADNDKLVRAIYFPKGVSSATSEQIGVLISEYIKAFDSALKSYFAYSADDELAARGAEIVDATCPFVSRIHKLAAENKGTVLVAGDPAHPEVEGILGHCTGKAYTFKTAEELEQIQNSENTFY